MEYICDEIIPITQHEKLDVYFLKTKVVDGIFDEFFLWWMTLVYLIKFKRIKNSRFFGWKSIQKNIYYHLFSNKWIIMYSF